MKYLVKLLKQHFKEDFDFYSFSFTVLLMALLIAFNYGFDLDNRWFGPYRGSATGVLFYFIMYAGIYYGIAIPLLIRSKKKLILSKASFWVKSFVILLVISMQRCLDLYKAQNHPFNYYRNVFTDRVFTNLELALFALIPLILLKIFLDKQNKDFYGLGIKGSRANNFFLLITLMIPLVTWASFQPDFLQMYPRFKPWRYPEIEGLSHLKMMINYELSYALAFIATEWVYRGALVIAMGFVLGKEAILPMVGVYVAIHFGKPMAECASSFVGGYLLGVFALYLRSIWGGVIVHIGLAWMMEAGALLVHLNQGKEF